MNVDLSLTVVCLKCSRQYPVYDIQPMADPLGYQIVIVPHECFPCECPTVTGNHRADCTKKLGRKQL